MRIAIAYREQTKSITVNQRYSSDRANFIGIFTKNKLHFFLAEGAANGAVTFQDVTNIIARRSERYYVRLAAGNFVDIAEEK